MELNEKELGFINYIMENSDGASERVGESEYPRFS